MTAPPERLPRRFPVAAPDGLIAAVLLSFLATAGLFYVNIMPALVEGLKVGLHFTAREAGQVASANVYGAALGAFTAVFIVRRIRWRKWAAAALIGLIAMDAVSDFLTTADALIIARFVHGTIGGLLVGIGFSVIARTRMPDRTFGMLLVVQFGLGGVGLMFLPALAKAHGTSVLFLALSAFSLVTLLMLPFLDRYPPRTQPVHEGAKPARMAWGLLGLALFAVFFFQSGNMALAAYMIGLGQHYGLADNYITNTLGIANWIAAVGSLAVVFLGTRYGRLVPLVGALVLTLAGNAAFHLSASPEVFAVANALTGVTWSFGIPYLLGLCAAFDTTGQSAALSGFFSKMGLATGPLVGGMVLNETHYPLLINAAVAALFVSAIIAVIPARALDVRGTN